SSMSNSASAPLPSCSNQPPVANAGADRSALSQTSVTFDGSASSDPDGSIVSYAWSFGDGTSGSGASVSHSFAAPGNYVVTLTVTDNLGGTASDTANVTITNRPPTA